MSDHTDTIRRALGHAPTTPLEREKALAALAALETERDRYREALEFYAEPTTYFGIGIFPDHPCGEFWEDIDEVPWPDGGTNHKPGKRARTALAGEPQKDEQT